MFVVVCLCFVSSEACKILLCFCLIRSSSFAGEETIIELITTLNLVPCLGGIPGKKKGTEKTVAC